MNQPLKWHGGKHYLAAKIIELMPGHTHYVEPYFGGGVVLLEKDPVGVSEVVNDLSRDLMNFWGVLQSVRAFACFKRLVEAVPFSQVEWEMASKPASDKIDRAVRFFVRCRQSRAGKFDEFATLSRNRTRRGMNEQASAWLTAVEGLPQVHARLKRVVILNQPALDVIRKQDGPDTLFYLDPPYLHETRKSKDDYAYEMSEDDHLELLDFINSVDGKVIISGYRSALYDSELREWNRKEFDLPNNAAGGKSKRRMTECVWMNY